MPTFARELRHAWRSLLRRKAYFVACAATLGLVLGANAAVFAVVNATMLKPLPFATRGPVVHLFGQPPGTTTVLQRNPLQQMEVPRLRERARTFARLEGFYVFERVVTLAGEPGVATGATVTPGLLTMMAAPISQGRSFTAREGEPGHFVALITDRYWRDTLGSRSVLGTSLIHFRKTPAFVMRTAAMSPDARAGAIDHLGSTVAPMPAFTISTMPSGSCR